MIYIALIILLFGIELVYFKIADRYKISSTNPTADPSHTSVTLRGGKEFSNCTSCILVFFGYVSWEITVAVLLVGTVSLLMTLSHYLNYHALLHMVLRFSVL
jgi:hypothetical protein